MDYFEWAKEYLDQAARIKKVVEKYERILADGTARNLEAINSKIWQYKHIYYDLRNTGRLLQRKAQKEVQNEAGT